MQNPPGDHWCEFCRSSLTTVVEGRLATPLRRLGAYFLDGLFPVGVLAIGGLVAVASGDFRNDQISTAPLFTVGVLLVAYVFWGFYLLSQGTSPGKTLLNMWVITRDGRRAGFFTMLIRETIGKFISGLVLSFGFLWILFDRDNQGWHDKLMGTYVVRSVP
jgi:uncharacterized RDD family membrane protein YckC